MERPITGFHVDQSGDWVAELSCGHDQHVRHSPPFQLRPWVLAEAGRSARIGSLLGCPLCDRCELPADLRLIRAGPEWTEATVPPGLLREHRLAPGTWGNIAIVEGRLSFALATELDRPRQLRVGMTQAIPPEVDHEVSPLGDVRFRIDFFAVHRSPRDSNRRSGRRRDSEH